MSNPKTNMLDSLDCSDATAVRLAGPSDEEELVDMVRVMHQDAEWGVLDRDGVPFPFSVEKTRATIQRATQCNRNAPDAGRAWLGIIGEPGRLQGSAYVALQEPSMSDGLFLAELWSWVRPDLRNSPASDALIACATSVSSA